MATEVDLSHQELQIIPSLALNITHLNLSYNNLLDIPSLDLPNLESLNLSHNRLMELPFLNTPRLRTLDLGHNEFHEMPLLPMVLALDISHNYLTEIHDRFRYQTQIRVLFIQHNRLKSIPEFFKNFQNLRHLYLGGNQLTHFPDWEFGELIVLALNNNHLRIGPYFGSKLQKLFLADNEIYIFGPDEDQLSMLQCLDLQRNENYFVSPHLQAITRV